jgi:hypothetical protein
MNSRESKREYWRRHVECGGRDPDGVGIYCRREGINLRNYYYWRERLGRPKSVSTQVTRPFVPVTVAQVERELPDPEWLGQFVSSFLRSAR